MLAGRADNADADDPFRPTFGEIPPPPQQKHAAADDDDDEDDRPAFPRMAERSSARAPPRPEAAAGEVILQIHQKLVGNEDGFQVYNQEDGSRQIPMAVQSTTVSTTLAKGMLVRSPWLVRCLNQPEGCSLTQDLALADDGSLAEFECDGGEADTRRGVTVKRGEGSVLELVLPSIGPGQKLLTIPGLMQVLDSAASPEAEADPSAVPAFTFDASQLPTSRLFGLLMWALILEAGSVASACRDEIVRKVDGGTVALALAVAHATSDADLLRRCYWILRDILCNAAGPPPSWLDGRHDVKLLRGGILCYQSVCRTPLRVLSQVLDGDLVRKREWLVAKDGYTLCQLHRIRGEGNCYPHTYELRLDHSNEIILTALREDEQSVCRMFAKDAANPERSEHCEEFLGTVSPNFWGTVFSLFDSGSDVDALVRASPSARDLPLRQRRDLCKIGYDTNILGDSPRKITVDFERNSERHHFENIQPRWDKKLNSYALPFFGRVKKASAKNFQLVVNNDPNTIYLMFGKISKDVFCLDFRSPLSTLDAMAIAIASLAKKRAVS